VTRAQIGFTPLRWASLHGHKEAISILIENDARDDLHSAAARGDTEAMEELMAQGNGDTAAVGVNRGGETALMWAATNGHEPAVKLLVKAKANVNARDQHGFTALMQASQGGHVEAMKGLCCTRRTRFPAARSVPLRCVESRARSPDYRARGRQRARARR
jgi:ankyrin repeat protein